MYVPSVLFSCLHAHSQTLGKTEAGTQGKQTTAADLAIPRGDAMQLF